MIRRSVRRGRRYRGRMDPFAFNDGYFLKYYRFPGKNSTPNNRCDKLKSLVNRSQSRGLLCGQTHLHFSFFLSNWSELHVSFHGVHKGITHAAPPISTLRNVHYKTIYRLKYTGLCGPRGAAGPSGRQLT